jgi:antitoxin YefM
MISEAEFAGRQEIVHLLSSPRNAERLLRSIRAADQDQRLEIVQRRYHC